MGNTTISTTTVHPVRVVSVHDGYVIASWNGNKERKYYEGDVAKWRVCEPVLIRSRLTARLATKAEIAEMKAKQQKTNHP
ncbi:hypothetical protein F6X40_09605 [Paraburkholderia sp. UCT31]|nr:hypothetical protein [Paraburkholderia sp. UCT31]